LVAAGILVNRVGVALLAAEGVKNVGCVALEYLRLSGKFPAATHPTTTKVDRVILLRGDFYRLIRLDENFSGNPQLLIQLPNHLQGQGTFTR